MRPTKPALRLHAQVCLARREDTRRPHERARSVQRGRRLLSHTSVLLIRSVSVCQGAAKPSRADWRGSIPALGSGPQRGVRAPLSPLSRRPYRSPLLSFHLLLALSKLVPPMQRHSQVVLDRDAAPRTLAPCPPSSRRPLRLPRRSRSRGTHPARGRPSHEHARVRSRTRGANRCSHRWTAVQSRAVQRRVTTASWRERPRSCHLPLSVFADHPADHVAGRHAEQRASVKRTRSLSGSRGETGSESALTKPPSTAQALTALNRVAEPTDIDAQARAGQPSPQLSPDARQPTRRPHLRPRVSPAEDIALVKTVEVLSYGAVRQGAIDWARVLERLQGKKRTRRQVEGRWNALVQQGEC